MVLPLVTVVMAIIAILALWAAFNHEEMKSEAKKNEEEWFTENSLNWVCHMIHILFVLICLCCGFTAQSTQWGHVERGQFTNHTFTGQA